MKGDKAVFFFAHGDGNDQFNFFVFVFNEIDASKIHPESNVGTCGFFILKMVVLP